MEKSVEECTDENLANWVRGTLGLRQKERHCFTEEQLDFLLILCEELGDREAIIRAFKRAYPEG